MIKRRFNVKTFLIALAIGVGLFILQRMLYDWSHGISTAMKLTPFLPKIDIIDNAIPLVPFFTVFYLWSFAFWIMGPMFVSRTSRKNFGNYLIGYLISLLIGFLILCFIPSFMDRGAEMLYERLGTDFFSNLLRTVYDGDGGKMAFNLLPSYHCLISVWCYLGLRKQPEVSKGLKLYSLIMAICIVASTLFCKQHYVLDASIGTGIAIGMYILTVKFNWGRCFEPLLEKIGF